MLHDYLHCLVFKEQSCSLSAFRLKRLVYLIAFSLACQELFWSFFQVFQRRFGVCQSRLAAPLRIRICQRLVLWYTSYWCLSTLLFIFLDYTCSVPAFSAKICPPHLLQQKIYLAKYVLSCRFQCFFVEILFQVGLQMRDFYAAI